MFLWQQPFELDAIHKQYQLLELPITVKAYLVLMDTEFNMSAYANAVKTFVKYSPHIFHHFFFQKLKLKLIPCI